MSEAGYAILTWAGLIALCAIAYKATGFEPLKTAALAQAFTLTVLLAAAGFVFVADL